MHIRKDNTSPHSRQRGHRPVIAIATALGTWLFFAALIAGEHVARLIQLGIEHFPATPDFTRADGTQLPVVEQLLLLAFKSDPAMDRLKTAEVP